MRYNNAPIQEAILDLRIAPRPDASAIEIAKAFEDIHEEFPKRQELPANTDFSLLIRPNLPPHIEGPALGGFRYTSADGKRVIHAGRDIFSFSLLPPYDHWESFVKQAWSLWERYRDTWKPLMISRAALRYINRFDFTEEDINLDDFFRTYPKIPLTIDAQPMRLAGFAMQLVLPLTDSGATAIINQGLTPPPGSAKLSIILDIDIFRDNIKIDPQRDTELRTILENLHTRKNDIFESSITDRTRGRIQ